VAEIRHNMKRKLKPTNKCQISRLGD